MGQSDPYGAIDRIYIDSVKAAPGRDVPVRVYLENDELLSSISVPLVYDANALTLKSISFSGSRVEYFDTQIIDPQDVTTADGQFLVISFRIYKEPLEAGDGPIFTALFTVSDTVSSGRLLSIDTMFYPPAGQLVLAEDETSGSIFPAFDAGMIYVSDSNAAPVFSSMEDQYVMEGDSLVLDVEVTDADRDALTLAITGKPVGATFTDNGDGTATFRWKPEYVGPYSADGSPFTVGFWASDGDLSVQKEIKVDVVNKNRQPLISAPETVDVLAGNDISFNVSAVDPDFEIVSWNVKNQPVLAQFDGQNPGSFDWTTEVTDSGTTEVEFIASDPQGLADTALVTIHVEATDIYLLRLDTVTAYPNETIDYLIYLDNKVAISSFDLLIYHDPIALTPLSGTLMDTRSDGFEYFNVTFNENGYMGNIRIVGIADETGQGIPELPAGEGPIVKLRFSVSGNLSFAGMHIPIRYRFLDQVEKDDNTFIDTNGEKVTQTDIVYVEGYVQIRGEDDIKVGDINLNGLAFEISDVIYFTNYLINPVLYPFSAVQYANSDVNRDNIPASVADLVTLINVVLNGGASQKQAAPVERKAEVYAVTSGSRTKLSYRTDFPAAGMFLEIATNKPVAVDDIHFGSAAANMMTDYVIGKNSIRFIIYDLHGSALPAGDNEILSIDNLTDFELKKIDLASSAGELVEADLASAENLLPDKFTLYQNYPNPFNPETQISFDLPKGDDINLTIFNILGQQVRVLASGSFDAGQHTVSWDSRDDQGRQVSSGIYFYRLTTSTQVDSKKMMLLK